MLYSGCFWQCCWKKPANRIWAKMFHPTLSSLLWLSVQRSKIRLATTLLSSRSMSLLEGYRLRSCQINVTRLLRSIFNRDSKAKEPITLNIWMLLHTEHFLLCLQPVVPLLLLRAWSPSMQALTCPARSHLTALINTHYIWLSLLLS